MTYPIQISAVVRVEKATGAPIIVFGADGCYAHIGQHSSIAREYYRRDTRAPNTPEERAAAGISDGLVRLSCGLEDTDDLLADVAQALDALGGRLDAAPEQAYSGRSCSR